MEQIDFIILNINLIQYKIEPNKTYIFVKQFDLVLTQWTFCAIWFKEVIKPNKTLVYLCQTIRFGLNSRDFWLDLV